MKFFVNIMFYFDDKFLCYNKYNQILGVPMQTMNLQIEESFFPHFKALIDSFINDNKIKIIDNDFPQHLACNSIEEVRRRVYLAEERINMGQSLNQEEYDKEMDDFFTNELGITR